LFNPEKPVKDFPAKKRRADKSFAIRLFAPIARWRDTMPRLVAVPVGIAGGVAPPIENALERGYSSCAQPRKV
jgi:hypothetical protein